MRQQAEAEKIKKRLREEHESRADVQRFKGMTREEKVRQAKDIMTQNVKKYNDSKAGRDTTQAEAERKVEELVRRMEREND